MDTIKITQPVALTGIQVTTFPNGIGQAFDTLMKTLPESEKRSWYGISNLDAAGKIVYYAMSTTRPGEITHKLAGEQFTVEAGNYLSITVKDWKTKTAAIKDIFHEIMNDPNCNNSKPCIEWYKEEDEMICMIQSIA